MVIALCLSAWTSAVGRAQSSSRRRKRRRSQRLSDASSAWPAVVKPKATKGQIHATTREVSADTGAEFFGPFSEILENRESVSSLAVVDAAIRTLRVAIAKETTDARSESWAKAASPAVKAYNSNSHAAPMGSAPEDVMFQYELKKQSGFDVAHNANVNERVA